MERKSYCTDRALMGPLEAPRDGGGPIVKSCSVLDCGVADSTASERPTRRRLPRFVGAGMPAECNPRPRRRAAPLQTQATLLPSLRASWKEDAGNLPSTSMRLEDELEIFVRTQLESLGWQLGRKKRRKKLAKRREELRQFGLREDKQEPPWFQTLQRDLSQKWGTVRLTAELHRQKVLGMWEEVQQGLRKALHLNDGTRNCSMHLLAGALSAAVSRTAVAPLERVKLEYVLRGATQRLDSMVHTILASEGVRGFWKGNVVNVMRTAPFKSVNFFAFDLYRKRLLSGSHPGRELSNVERAVAGAAAGVTATILCFPMDTIRTRLMAHGGEKFGGVVGCLVHMVTHEGPLSLYRGILPGVISMAPAGAVFYGVYDLLKVSYLNSPEGQQATRERHRTHELAAAAGEGPQSSESRVALPHVPEVELGAVRTLLFGAIAGACAETTTYPLEVIRRQLQMQGARGVNLGMKKTLEEILRRGGVKALYAGLLPALLQVLPSAALSYYVYELCKSGFGVQ